MTAAGRGNGFPNSQLASTHPWEPSRAGHRSCHVLLQQTPALTPGTFPRVNPRREYTHTPPHAPHRPCKLLRSRTLRQCQQIKAWLTEEAGYRVVWVLPIHFMHCGNTCLAWSGTGLLHQALTGPRKHPSRSPLPQHAQRPHQPHGHLGLWCFHPPSHPLLGEYGQEMNDSSVHWKVRGLKEALERGGPQNNLLGQIKTFRKPVCAF